MSLASRSLFLGVLAASAATLVAASSRADIAPPSGWKESCTMEKVKQAGDECLSCSAFYGNAQHCSILLASYSFQSRCKTRGASVWSELWCRTASPSQKKVPANVMAALSNSNDNAGIDANPPAPTTTADAATSAAPSTSTTAQPSATTEPSATTTASTAKPATTTTEPKLPIDETKKGACGACEIGAGSSSIAGLAPLALAFAVAVARRRRR